MVLRSKYVCHSQALIMLKTQSIESSIEFDMNGMMVLLFVSGRNQKSAQNIEIVQARFQATVDNIV